MHPLIQRAIKYLVNKSLKNVVVIEAIKLLESPIKDMCDSIWVVTSGIETQISRMAINRLTTEKEARARLANQSLQEEKIREANVIIQNDETLVDTWKQVLAAWMVTVINRRLDVQEHPKELIEDRKKKLHSVRAMPKHAGHIANFLNKGKPVEEKLEDLDVLERFGDNAYYLLMEEDEIIGLVGWQVENLVALVKEFVIISKDDMNKGIRLLIKELESSSQALNTEVVYVKVDVNYSSKTVWRDLGYQLIDIDDVKVNIWKNAARKLVEDGYYLMFKELRSDRVLHPM